MQAFCIEINEFIYGTDTQIDPQQTNLIISDLVKKNLQSSDYHKNKVEIFCHEFCQTCLPVMLEKSGYLQQFGDFDITVTNTIHQVIDEILDEMTWNEIRKEIESKM
jgi:hypothetical protein